ncbi:proline-specific peptidase [Phlegmacium glaucopus]|nr:proline-specific peptidase [Phlegmacium glaucopus]
MATTPTPNVVEGEIEFHVPSAGKPCKTWYRLIGDLHSGKRPLIALHGGPGASSDYLFVFANITSAHGIPVILYDQLGSGRSTHLPEKMGDGSFWTVQLFLDELDNLLSHFKIQDDYDLLGHSWGGMLAANHAIRTPSGLNRLAIMSSPPSMPLWVAEQNRLRSGLPKDVQDTLTKHEDAGTTSDKEYEAATQVFNDHHLCRLKPSPPELAAVFEWIEKDPTVYHTMNGPNEFHVVGTLKDWNIIDQLHKINVPTLLTNGRYDEATDTVVYPFFKHIPRVKWVQFTESSHVAQHEETERVMEVVGQFFTH